MKRLLVSALLLAGCATAPADEDLSAYAAALAGRYDNAAQYAAAPNDMKDAPSGPEDDWIEPQAVSFTVVSAPAVAPAIVYAEWTRPDGSVSKQRVWALRQAPTGVTLDALEFREPSGFAGKGPEAFATLRSADLKDPIPGCTLAVAGAAGGWNAQTDPETCKAGPVGLDIRITVMPTGVLYQEQGRLPDGSYAFRIPAPAPFEFRRR